jgi:hypothetical protein
MGSQSLISHRLADLAPETWMQIFEWACRDSGATGRSLGLVNKTFRSLSRSSAYQSIHLPREKHIFAFRDLLSTLPADQKRVKFLHTPSPHIFMNALSLDDDDIEDDDEDEFEEDFGYDQTVEQEGSDSLRCEAFRDILNQVSSSLLVLSVYWNSRSPVPLGEVLVTLPRLEELHINRRFVDPPPHLYTQETRPQPMFANLRRLHFAGQYLGEEPLPFNDFLAQIAPQLTHLYVPVFCIRSTILISFAFLCLLWLSCRSLKSKLQDTLQVVVVDMGPSIIYEATSGPESSDQIATLVFGGPPADGKTLTLITNEDSEWTEHSEGWEARWKLSNGARNRTPWLTW